jgi:hypothetical protein
MPTFNDWHRFYDPWYKHVDDVAQEFLTSARGQPLRRLCMKLGVSRDDVTKYFQLFMHVDEDQSGKVTLDEFFNYLKTEWTPFIAKAFRQFDTDKEEDSADKLEPDEFIIGLMNYCTLTPDMLARFAFEMCESSFDPFPLTSAPLSNSSLPTQPSFATLARSLAQTMTTDLNS